MVFDLQTYSQCQERKQQQQQQQIGFGTWERC